MLDELVALIAREVRDVVGVAGDEVVEPDDLVTVREKAIGEMRAEEAGAAGDQDSHDCSPRPIER